MAKLEETARFQCKDDQGNSFTVIERTKIVEFKPLSGAAQKAKGTVDYVTSTGLDVNQIDDDTYEIVQSDLIIRRSK